MKKRWFILGILLSLLLLTGFTLLRSPKAEVYNIRTNEDRLRWLSSIGRSAEPAPLSARTISLPEELTPVLEEYNKLQLAQGFDLHRYCGRELSLYSYKAEETYNGETLYYSIYVYDDRIVAADAHTASLNGAMMGLLRTDGT